MNYARLLQLYICAVYSGQDVTVVLLSHGCHQVACTCICLCHVAVATTVIVCIPATYDSCHCTYILALF